MTGAGRFSVLFHQADGRQDFGNRVELEYRKGADEETATLSVIYIIGRGSFRNDLSEL